MKSKIWIILSREYITRVRKKTFLLMTILTPFLFALLFILPILLTLGLESQKVVEVFDENKIFLERLKSDKKLKYIACKETDLEKAKASLKKSDNYAILYLPKFDIEDPKGVKIFAEKSVSIEVESQITSQVEKTIEDIRFLNSGIDRKTLDKIKTNIVIDTRKLSGEESSAGLAFAIGFGSAFLIYLSVFLYGAQVMRGVVEEKSNKIIEVIISSVKPFELLMGKILGVALVGLTQFALWILLTFAIVSVATPFLDTKKIAEQQMEEAIGKNEKIKEQVNKQQAKMGGALGALANVPVTKIVVTFLFYFVFGYLMYSALFAAVASAVDTEMEAQQFVTPISMPLIIAFVAAQAIIRDPDGQVAFWLSIFPLTSPVVMMIRMPFEVPLWQLILSMALLVLGFVGTAWLAGRIYRVGILTHGEKVTYKKLWAWLFYKM